jgi:2-keto-4-pentenoate hydratase
MTDLAAMIVEAIRTKTSIEIGDISPPAGPAEAYAVQAEVMRLLGVKPQGCKMALRDGQILSAPLLSASPSDRFPFEPGLRLEAELGLVLGRDLPVRPQPYARADILEAIAGVSLAAEFIRSRYKGGAQGRAPLLLADLMSNVGYRLGPALERSILESDRPLGRLTVGMAGKIVFDADAQHPDGDPVKALVAYANRPDRPSGDLRAGSVMTTGTLCGALLIDRHSTVVITLDGTGYTIDMAA